VSGQLQWLKIGLRPLEAILIGLVKRMIRYLTLMIGALRRLGPIPAQMKEGMRYRPYWQMHLNRYRNLRRKEMMLRMRKRKRSITWHL
jgi:hypothetical protein